jgi:hypothetical protein
VFSGRAHSCEQVDVRGQTKRNRCRSESVHSSSDFLSLELFPTHPLTSTLPASVARIAYVPPFRTTPNSHSSGRSHPARAFVRASPDRVEPGATSSLQSSFPPVLFSRRPPLKSNRQPPSVPSAPSNCLLRFPAQTLSLAYAFRHGHPPLCPLSLWHQQIQLSAPKNLLLFHRIVSVFAR